jgi:hypothetical protein
MADETSAPLPQPKPWYRLSLTTWIMVGLVAGGFLGWIRPDWGNNVYFLRDIFLNLIKLSRRWSSRPWWSASPGAAT